MYAQGNIFERKRACVYVSGPTFERIYTLLHVSDHTLVRIYALTGLSGDLLVPVKALFAYFPSLSRGFSVGPELGRRVFFGIDEYFIINDHRFHRFHDNAVVNSGCTHPHLACILPCRQQVGKCNVTPDGIRGSDSAVRVAGAALALGVAVHGRVDAHINELHPANNNLFDAAHGQPAVNGSGLYAAQPGILLHRYQVFELKQFHVYLTEYTRNNEKQLILAA